MREVLKALTAFGDKVVKVAIVLGEVTESVFKPIDAFFALPFMKRLGHWLGLLVVLGFDLLLLYCLAWVLVTAHSAAGALNCVAWLVVVNVFLPWHAGPLIFEKRIKNKWRSVCKHIGMLSSHTYLDKKGNEVKGTRYPSLAWVQGRKGAWQAQVKPLHGQSFKEFEPHLEAFKLAFGVASLRFELVGHSKIMLYASMDEPIEPATQAVPAEGEFADHQGARSLLVSCPIATGFDGAVYRLPVLDSHILIAGSTGAGKGSYIWSLVIGLAPAKAAGLVKFWGLDPKRVELAIAPKWWDHYACRAKEMIELLEEAVEDMYRRADNLAGIARKFTPSTEMPVNVIIVDEVAYLSSLMGNSKEGKALRERGDMALQVLLSQGRSAGYVVVGALQDPRKETLGYRDLFTVRVALRLPGEMTDLVLGRGAKEAGAACETIPIGPMGAGVGYVLADGQAVPYRIRAYWWDDATIREYADLVEYAKAGLFQVPQYQPEQNTDELDYAVVDESQEFYEAES